MSRLEKNRKYALVVSCESEDTDALSYAADLTQALLEGGCEVSGPRASPGCVATPQVFVGIDDLGSPHPNARLLVDVLIAAETNVKVVKVANVEPGGCCLVVGGRI